ncbi:MAG: efflux RND transporter permease subunit, partial [Saprospiraceae bacterium]|nr:efflux RND transporter permease subunit [Saprospiraceae bacterium]
MVVTPIEQELRTLAGIDKMTSISFPGSGRVNLELDPEAPNRDRIVSDVSVAVERADLPTDLPDDPKVTEIDGSVFPILQVAVSAPRTDIELKWLGNKIRDDLLTIAGVGRVVITGERKAEIRITVDPEKLRRYRLSVEDLAQLLDRWNINAPGGDITTQTGQKSVRINGEFQSADDVKNLVIRANERGQSLKFSDVAKVTETLEVPQTLNALKGEPSLDIIVFKKTDADILNTVALVKEYLTTIKQRYGGDIDTGTAQDWSRATNLRLSVLTNNGLVGLILVLLSLVFFLRPSVAITTTLGLPIIVFSGLFILNVGDVTLNLVSMMGFIMVLGMLVDDAIIVGENIT